MLIFDFLENGLGIVSPPHFVYDFARKMFLKLYSGISGNLVVKSKLPPQSGSVALRQLNPIHKGATMFFLKFLLTGQVSLPEHFYFLIYLSICVLQLFFNQVVTSS